METLFIGSEEVKKELPEDAARFVGIDSDVREILTKCAEIKNVVNACNQDGLLKRLEGVQKLLEICEKSLNEYLASKRRAFPRFYFVSTTDLLDILSNGNRPRVVMEKIPKIVQCIGTVTMQDNGEDQRPSAISWDSCVGKEHIDMVAPCQLNNKVEMYMQDFLDAATETLRRTLHRAIKSYGTKAREDSVLYWVF